MLRTKSLLSYTFALSALLCALALPATGLAQSRRLGTGPDLKTMAIRPFIGTQGDLRMDDRVIRPVTSQDYLLLGADLPFGDHEGLDILGGLRLGLNDRSVQLQAVADMVYHFDVGPDGDLWVGGGASVKVGLSRVQGSEIAIGGRLVAGGSIRFSKSFAVFTQLAIPEIDLRFLPSPLTIGTIEWIIGPQLNF